MKSLQSLSFICLLGLLLTSCGDPNEVLTWQPSSQSSGSGSSGGAGGSGDGGSGGPITQPMPAPKPAYIDNGFIRLGVDLNKGGAITYLAAPGGKNMVNNWDLGRQIQASYFSGPIPYTPNGKDPYYLWKAIGWNAIQAGDCYGNGSKVVDFKNQGNSMYIKTVPMQWPLNFEVSESVFETWITMDGNTIKIRHKLINARSDKTFYDARPQELPAVYLNAEYHNFYTYTEHQPFTGGAMTKINYQNSLNDVFDTKAFQSTENWAALVNDSNWGLGIWKPNHYYFIAASIEKPRTGEEFDRQAAYMSPSGYEIIDHNIVYDYEYTLVAGTVEQIRQFVYSQPRPSKGPDYRFVADRQSWWYYQGKDSGFPISNELNIPLDKGSFLMIGPSAHWVAANVPKLYVKGAFKTDATKARLRWRLPDDPEFLADRVLDFPIVGDGQYRTYELDMTQSANWKGIITLLGFEPALGEKGGSGKYAKIQAISIKP